MLEERVKKVLGQIFNIDVNHIDDSTSPDTVEKWDSLGHMNLIVCLEEEFGISFNEIQILEMLNYPLILLTLKENFNIN